MFEYLTVIGGAALIFAGLRNRGDGAKAITIAVLLLMVLVDIKFIANDEMREWVSEGSRVFMVRSAAELCLVFLLHIRPCRETAIIMMLALCSVVVNIIGFSFDLRGIDLDFVVNPLLMTIFYAMIAVIFSKGLSDGIYRYINRLSIVHCYCTGHLKIHSKGSRR